MQSLSHVIHRASDTVGTWTDNLQASYEERKSKVKEFVQVWMKVQVKHHMQILVDRIPPYLKEKLHDPYMPACVKRFLHRTIDSIWPDVRHEIMWEVSVMIDGDQKAYDEGQGHVPEQCCLLAFFRHRLFPYDKGIWECLRDPAFVVVNILCYVPVYGIWAWMFLLIFLIIDKRDEYQLVYFILSFKGCQFFSWGIIKGLAGFVQYFACVTFPNLNDLVKFRRLLFRPTPVPGPTSDPTSGPSRCMTNGPGMAESYPILVASWLLPLVLVWICMILLPYSEEKGRSKLKTLRDSEDETAPNANNADGTQSNATRGAKFTAGGYLRRMLIFDLVVFVLCVGLLCVIVWTQPHTGNNSQLSSLYNANDDNWQVKQTFYCCQFIYGLFSIVFVPFNLPFLQVVLTHTVPTAYDKQGRCCKFKGADPPEPDKEEEEFQRGSSRLLSKIKGDNFMSYLETTMAGGSVSLQEMQTNIRSRANNLTSNPENQEEATV